MFKIYNLFNKTDTQTSYKKMYNFAQQHRTELINLLEKRNALMLLHGLYLQTQICCEKEEERDYYMADNVIFSIDSLASIQEKIAIWGHTEHLRKTNFGHFELTTSMGSIITKKYGNDYAVLALLSGKGDRKAYKVELGVYRLKTFDITSPPQYSVEYECNKIYSQKVKDIHDHYLYFRLSNTNKDKYNLMRSLGVGNSSLYEFSETPFRKSYDAILYINTSTPAHVNVN